jgi:hypothetical protein
MVRLFAIALLIYGIGRLELAASILAYNENVVGPSLFFSLSSSIVPILISIMLWHFPLTVAKKILPPSSEAPTNISPHAFLTVIVIGIGIYTLYYAIVDSVFWLTLNNCSKKVST